MQFPKVLHFLAIATLGAPTLAHSPAAACSEAELAATAPELYARGHPGNSGSSQSPARFKLNKNCKCNKGFTANDAANTGNPNGAWT
ncbi:hypothetical protein PspLS_07543 [Pyricularia sp. CBS 133598]|nr:hypothetical protein PspLS_07543 [Pyricularia sp. CBS 133598]